MGRKKRERRAVTAAEAHLFEQLRDGKTGAKWTLGAHFIGQELQFYAHRPRLAIQIGESLDTLSEQVLEMHGLRVLVYSEEDVLMRVSQVVREIRDAVKARQSWEGVRAESLAYAYGDRR